MNRQGSGPERLDAIPGLTTQERRDRTARKSLSTLKVGDVVVEVVDVVVAVVFFVVAFFVVRNTIQYVVVKKVPQKYKDKFINIPIIGQTFAVAWNLSKGLGIGF